MAWSDGDLWYYDTSAGGNAAVITPSAGTVPTGNLGVVVSPEDFILLLGANSNGRRIQWPDQLDHTNWDVTDITNSAGFLDLPGKGAIRAGRRGQEETLVWTRTNLFAVRFIGGELVYTAVEVGQEGAVSRRAMAMLGSKAFCMSGRGFHVYDGYTRDLPCTLSDYVFSDLNRVQASKIWAETRSEFGEVIWHYPSGSSTECDRAIVYNDNMGIWYPLEIARTGGEDQGALPYPLAVDAAGLVWQHESGSTYTGVTGAPYAETGPFELGNGDVLMDLLSLIPDEKTLGDLDIYLFTSEYPTAAETESGPYTPANPTDLRLTARQARLKIAQANPGWRFGTVRLEVQPGSAR